MHCDIVLPIYNSLTYVKPCLNAVLNHTQNVDYHVCLINDASDSVTSNYLKTQVAHYSQFSLHTNTSNLGFVKSCNLGMTKGTAPYVLLLNSDVVVTPNWLARLIACAESDSLIASVNPLTNHAAQIDLPMLPGANFYDMDVYLAQHAPCHYPDVVTGVGFCMLLRRKALEHVSLFDEIYGQGYCEESDLCMRLTTQGYRTVVADNVYVYHQGGASFSDNLARYRRNRKLFDERWKKAYWQQFRAYRKRNPLKPIKELFALKQRFDPMPTMWTNYRAFLRAWQQKNTVDLMLAPLRSLRRLLHAYTPIPDPGKIQAVTRPKRLRVTYLLNKFVIAGGVLSVVQLVNELILLGIEARIAALFADPEIKNWRLYTEPMVFKNSDALIQHLPETDIVVATHWETAKWANQIVEKGLATTSCYYLQDYESWFFPEKALEKRQTVEATYALIQHKIVTSEWLKELLAKNNHESHKICIGMDLDLFYPREVEKPSHPVIVAMARPGTPWRGYATLIAALQQVKAVLPAVEIVLFGDSQLFKQKIPFAYTDKGIISQQNHLAELYSHADIFVDASDYQGFGRPALEAMACGVACVLTNEGGVMEYARDKENCLLIPPKQPKACAEAILTILNNPPLQQQLIQQGLATVTHYDMQTEAKNTLAYFNSVSGR